MASRSAKELEKELARVTRKLRELEKATEAQTRAEKDQTREAKKRAPGIGAQLVGAARGAARGLAATAIRGLADPMLTTRELEARLGKQVGAALGGVTVAGFRLGPELGALVGEMGPDIARVLGREVGGVAGRGIGAAGEELDRAIQAVRQGPAAAALEAQARRRFLERGVQGAAGARLARLAEAGVEITPEMAEEVVRPFLRLQERRLRAAILTRRAVDEMGIDGSE